MTKEDLNATFWAYYLFWRQNMTIVFNNLEWLCILNLVISCFSPKVCHLIPSKGGSPWNGCKALSSHLSSPFLSTCLLCHSCTILLAPASDLCIFCSFCPKCSSSSHSQHRSPSSFMSLLKCLVTALCKLMPLPSQFPHIYPCFIFLPDTTLSDLVILAHKSQLLNKFSIILVGGC